LNNLKTTSQKKVILFSEKQGKLADFDVFNRHHRYSNQNIVMHIAFVGGGFGNPGVHNLLEPATFEFP
jgi:3-deoxy-D-manno-octulosonic-acid transferase